MFPFRKPIRAVPSFTRRSDLARLLRRGSVGVELGVAKGQFSEKLLQTGRFSHLFSIDMWAGDRGHTSSQYKSALRRLLPHKHRNTTIRLTFDEALDLFPDSYFDFIYIDGYAHTGEEGGATLATWWPKLKPGGIMAGDDYSPRWPLVVASVDAFIAANGLTPFVLTPAVVEDAYSKFPSWVTAKPLEAGGRLSPAVAPENLQATSVPEAAAPEGRKANAK